VDRVEADVGVLPAEELNTVGKAGKQEDPADLVVRHAGSDNRPDRGERERKDQEREATDAGEDVARQDAARTGPQQDQRCERHHDAEAPDDRRDSTRRQVAASRGKADPGCAGAAPAIATRSSESRQGELVHRSALSPRNLFLARAPVLQPE
jgi:hypothetical protein